MNEYKIKLQAQSLSFFYESTETVYAENLEEAKQKAVKQYSNRTLINRHLIKIIQ